MDQVLLARLVSEKAKSGGGGGGSGGGGGNEPTAHPVIPFSANADKKLASGPVTKDQGPSSMYIFTSSNPIRRYATKIIEWPYPLLQPFLYYYY